MSEEWWDLYDKDGVSLDIKIKRGHPLDTTQYHKVLHNWIFNEHGEFLVQKRAPHLKWCPDMWATTTGSIISGSTDEKIEAYRELKEELGLDDSHIDLEFLEKIILGQSIVYIFSGFMPKHISKHIALNDEVTEYGWMKFSKIMELRKQQLFAHYSDELIHIVSKIKPF